MVEADKKKYSVLDVLHSQKGFSLAELMITLILVGLITLAVAGGVGMVVRSYSKVVDRADAEQLLSTAVSRITDELSYAMPYDAKNTVKDPTNTKTVDFVSGLTGMRVRITAGTDTDESMHMYYYYKENPSSTELTEIPLIDSKLQKRMSINFGNISYDKDKGLFTIEDIAVKLKGRGDTPVKIDSYKVARINNQVQS